MFPTRANWWTRRAPDGTRSSFCCGGLTDFARPNERCRRKIDLHFGEPHFRELEPAGRVVAAAGRRPFSGVLNTLIAIYVDYLALCVIVRLKRRFMKISRELSDEAVLREIGSRLATVRLAQNLTQAALADEAGLSKRTVERLESGEVAARLSGLVRVCRALDMVDRLEALVPSPTVSPVEQLKLAGRHRKRASGRRRSTTSTKKKWKWGDES
jgi:transcriptional regulator with XRE-family HTH domain